MVKRELKQRKLMKKTLLSLLLASALFAATTHNAKVLETMSSGGYTYMKVQDGTKSYWIAMTQRDTKVGDTLKFSEQGWMQNFHSKTLNRTFDSILFASDATVVSPVAQEQQKPSQMHSSLALKGTLSIAELFKNRDKYVGKRVTVRAKVTKTASAIMKRNWVHLQDGSNFGNMDDLVFTSTQTPPAVGSIVYATGEVVKDKDFGYGYFYPLIIQDASFKK